jgi:hypothetical protein
MELDKETVVDESKDVLPENKDEPIIEVKTTIDNPIKVNDGPIEIEKPSTDDVPYWEAIDTYRNEIISSVKRSKTRSTISMAIIIICSIAGLILLSFSQTVTNIIAWCLLGVAVVVILIFFILNRRVDRPDFQGYVVKASTAINKVSFADGKFSNVVYFPKDKLELGEVFAEGVYSGLTNSISRNLVKGAYSDCHFKMCECALFTGAGRQRKTAFVGKYINFVNSLDFEGRFLFIIKGKESVDQPTALDDLEPLESTDEFFIYGPKGSNVKDVFGTKFISKIKSLKVDKHLLNVIFCVWAGHTSLYLSYDDLVNELPVDKKFNPDGVKQFQKELPEFMEVLAEIAK